MGGYSFIKEAVEWTCSSVMHLIACMQSNGMLRRNVSGLLDVMQASRTAAKNLLCWELMVLRSSPLSQGYLPVFWLVIFMISTATAMEI